MKKLILSLFLATVAVVAFADLPDYNLYSAGEGNDGSYVISVTMNVKKVTKTIEDEIKQCAVHGVMFRGVSSSNGYSGHQPLIKDPNVADVKSKEINAFFSEGKYKLYANLMPSTFTSVKNKAKKVYEVSAVVTVNKEALNKYLEEQGIIKGFSDLW